MTMIAVCGPGEASERERAWAEEIGELLAEAGATILCGGLGGVMDAVARGSSRRGGTVVGLLPGTDTLGASPSLGVAIPTGLGEARNVVLVRAADALIAVAGEFGTLSEIALALKIGTPVVGLHTWELTKDGRPIDPDPIARAEDPAGAVEIALRLAGRP